MKHKYLLPLTDHPELIDQDKTKYKNVVQWRYDNSVHGRFLDRDQVLRRSVRHVENSSSKDFRDDLIGLIYVLFAIGCAGLIAAGFSG